jgi:hypothetical protein
MQVDKNLLGTVSHFYNRYALSETVIAGSLLIRDGVVTVGGDAKKAGVGTFTKALGIAANAVTYSTTQADVAAVDAGLGRMDSLGRSVGVIINPFHVLRARIAGSATTGAALSTAAPAAIVTNTSADTAGITITAAEVGTVNMRGGVMIGRTGANGGVTRRIGVHTDNTSEAVVVPFPYTIAVGDTFYRLPFSKACENVQLTTLLDEVDASIVFATGGAAAVLRVILPHGPSNNQTDQLYLDFTLTDRHFV